MDFFFEFASLVLIMLLGHWIEMKAVGDAGDAQKSLAELLPKDVHLVLEDDSIEIRPVTELVVGDIVIGGSTNGEGILYVKVEETGDKSFISQVQTLVSQAQSQPSRAEDLANKVAGLLFYIAVIVPVIAFLLGYSFLICKQQSVLLLPL